MLVGTVHKIFRYPVKSMAGEQVKRSMLDQYGMIGDRCWSMVRVDSGDITGGKQFPRLMDLKARHVQEHPQNRVYGGAIPAVEIRFPCGKTARSDTNPNSLISDYAGSALHLHPLEPPENREHYRYSVPLDDSAILKLLGIGPNESPPDLSVYEESLFQLVTEYCSPPGTYHDMFPIHLMTTSTLSHMRQTSGEDFVEQRFRPNYLIETIPSIKGMAEFDWVGKRLQVGQSELRIDAKTIRCSMPSRAQAANNLPRNPAISKSLFKTANRFMGTYATVAVAGPVNEGDQVVLIESG